MPTLQSALVSCAIAALSARGGVGMYADEAGKLDWHRENLGRVVSAGFHGQEGLTVVGKASTLASVNSRTGNLVWRRVLTPAESIVATSTPSPGRPTATLSAGGRTVRLWDSHDGALLWETVLALQGGGGVEESGPSGEDEDGGVTSQGGGVGSPGSTPGVVVTEGGNVVVLSSREIHVLSAATGAVQGQWWCDPSREPDLAALVGSDAEVTFTSLRPAAGGDGRLLAGGWASGKGSSSEVQAFVVAEIYPAERLVTFKSAKATGCEIHTSAGMALVRALGEAGEEGGSIMAGVCKGGGSLAVFGPSFDAPSVRAVPLPAGLFQASRKPAATTLSELAGSLGALVELRDDASGTSAAVALSTSARGGVAVVQGSETTRDAWRCPSDPARSTSCALAAAVSPSGKIFAATGTAGKEGLIVRVAGVGDAPGEPTEKPMALLSAPMTSSRGRSELVRAVYLEAQGPGAKCSPENGFEACFRALVVGGDDSATMVGHRGVEWVREEALAEVDQVVFVDYSTDELTLLAGQTTEHQTPGWQERYRLLHHDFVGYVASTAKSLASVRLPGSEAPETEDAGGSSFGLHKLAICSTKAGKLFGLDMSDGSIMWSLVLPPLAEDAKVLLHASRSKPSFGFNTEVAAIAQGAEHTRLWWLDAVTGAETRTEELPYKVASSLPLSVKDAEDRSIIMLVDGEGGVRAAPSTESSSAALVELLPRLHHHNFSRRGLESFVVVKEASPEGGDVLTSAPVASVSLTSNARLVARAYPDRRDTVQTPAHTLGDDSLLIKYLNPRLLAVATLSPQDGVAPGGSKGERLTVTVMDHVSGRILYRIVHKGAAEPVHMVVSESWVIYSYWSAAAQRTEISTLSLYEGMIDKYGLSPFNRPEWKEAFSSFESRVPIVTQKTFIFPHSITALSVTLTQRGITAKNILIGTALGQVVMLDRRFLDPRRPVEEPSKVEKEEKLVQYSPHLPVIPTNVLSYYKAIEGVDRIFTEPTGLESTTLVLAVGLDIFGSRAAPSKTYDKLDPNFNYALLALVLSAMTVAVLVTRHFAASKRLKDQWS